MHSYFLGIDVGTQGVRVVLLDDAGNTIGTSEKVFPLTPHSREEQSPALEEQAHRCRRLADAVSDRYTSGILRTMAEGYERNARALRQP